MYSTTKSNSFIADRLNEYADILEQQQANRFRVEAYRRAASSIVNLDRDLADVYQQGGSKALTQLETIGTGIASSIGELLQTGRWSRLDRLRGALDPLKVFQTVPGIGSELAARIHDRLGVDTLEQLEAAAHDGRLRKVAGIGKKREQMIKAGLAALLSRAPKAINRNASAGPAVELLLDVDEEYRKQSALGHLPTITPRRFNPNQRPWLPILHTTRGVWHFTALFSNSARAHELHRTDDWVVIYFYDDNHDEGQHTVVTETRGPLKGLRIVRGREAECNDVYRSTSEAGVRRIAS
ncbi:helix-hairpin-helix domain-containing protein [Congregibacter variabilis]|uniref:Helix-hairpin-helix domain-containing protein n=1 Tax=Congregibacter variabilis TaxID=3081200 RepID=A0ABZ0I240_9GAMM|nr:helix-hairpin-helix domain-containing protein [Congregibacter sp. IMCC43200]